MVTVKGIMDLNGRKIKLDEKVKNLEKLKSPTPDTKRFGLFEIHTPLWMVHGKHSTEGV